MSASVAAADLAIRAGDRVFFEAGEDCWREAASGRFRRR
jgi:hypothetical protein